MVDLAQRPTRVLFLCTANACRSQIAEGVFPMIGGDRFVVLSAGVEPAGFVHPLAVRVVEEVGGRIGESGSKGLVEFARTVEPSRRPDVVVSLCEHATRRYRSFGVGAPLVKLHCPDPAAIHGNDDEKLAGFRWVRDELSVRLEDLLEQGRLDPKSKRWWRRLRRSATR